MTRNSPPPVKIESTSYRDWPRAFRCVVGQTELVVVVSIGPRILSLRQGGGPNLLFEDGSGFGLNGWRLYGGHRFTLAPESELSYAPDNQLCETRVTDEGLYLIQPRGPEGLEKTLRIGPVPEGGGFELTHCVTNRGGRPWRGAAWACTCLKPEGQVLLPSRSHEEVSVVGSSNGPADRIVRFPTPTGTIVLVHDARGARYWTMPGADYALPGDPQWGWTGAGFVVRPPLRRGKVGLFSPQPRLALLRPEGMFLISSTDTAADGEYPHGGCNLEVYTCAGYTELETLGPLTTLGPGERLAHRQDWRILPVPADTLSSTPGEPPWSRLTEEQPIANNGGDAASGRLEPIPHSIS
jgi:hypothetical protein